MASSTNILTTGDADYKHCNGKYITAMGTRLNGTFRSTDDKKAYSRGESWTQSHVDTRWESNVWKLPDELCSCAEELAGHGDCKQETLEMMEERVRGGKWIDDLLISQVEPGVRALSVGQTIHVEE